MMKNGKLADDVKAGVGKRQRFSARLKDGRAGGVALLYGLVYQRGDGLDTANKKIGEGFLQVADCRIHQSLSTE